MQELGINAYRFSISWPRILPSGRGGVNQAGLDFYDRMLDELLASGIEPYVTLYHWDLPQELENRGGWPARDTAGAFAEYVEVVASRLGDRVPNWITQNEPWVVSWLGYGLGEHAPGRRSDADALAAAHHVLLAHGRAAEVLRREAPAARVGVTVDLYPTYPLTDSEEDIDAARLLDGSRNRWFLDPLFGRGYPSDMLEHYERILPHDRRRRPRRRSRRHSTSSGSTTTAAPSFVPGRIRRGRSRSTSPMPSAPRWGGRCIRTA